MEEPTIYTTTKSPIAHEKSDLQILAEALQELSNRVAVLEHQSSCHHENFEILSTNRRYRNLGFVEPKLVVTQRLYCPDCKKTWTHF
jgi:hypothetical protein